jgi:hypothetical protein
MTFVLGCALLVCGVYLGWSKRAEFSRLVPADKEGAEVFNERLEASRMLSTTNSLEPIVFRAEHRRDSRRSGSAEARSRSKRREAVSRV